jgi:hypothetical protein
MDHVAKVKTWQREKLYNFWKKWYFPANATLFIVGDITTPGAVSETVKCIEKSFGSVPEAKNEDGTPKLRHLGMPPLPHNFGSGPIRPGTQTRSKCLIYVIKGGLYLTSEWMPWLCEFVDALTSRYFGHTSTRNVHEYCIHID